MAKRTDAASGSRLDTAARAAALRSMAERELDILVVGGGVVGAGAALDAATRGLDVGIVEARDWASGTSSRSSKLIHGGIRYLEQLDFTLVREALVERGLLLQRIAPHLVRPVRFLYPLHRRFVERAYVGAGMLLYDVFARTGLRPPGVAHHRHLTRRQVRRAMPGLDPRRIVGGLRYFDAQVDDARYVTTLVRTAAHYGARAANRAPVEEYVREGERVVGVVVRDLDTGRSVTIRARRVVNATGVWTDETEALAGAAGTALTVRASKGIHLVVPRDRFASTMGLLLRTEFSVLFVIPWGRHWIIGTTDTQWSLDREHPVATAVDIDYLLAQVNRVLARPLTRDDVEGVYAGLRPLVEGEADETTRLSREHVVTHPAPGLVVIAGGKFTTYRVMAADAIDAAVAGLSGEVPRSATEEIGLLGAEGFRAAWNSRARMAAESGLPVERVERLLRRYGSLVSEVLELIRADPSLGETLPGTVDYVGAEVVYAATHEDAGHLADVLARRTRLEMESWDHGVSAAPVAARLLAGVLGWDEGRVDREVEEYVAAVEAERSAGEQRDDRAALRVRTAAADRVRL